MNNNKGSKKKILAISSGGGHWIQMLRLRKAFDGCKVIYVTVNKGYSKSVPGSKFYIINDANQNKKLALLLLTFKIFIIVVKERPDVIISTGAAPGYFALLFGKILRARTIWLDSIANTENLSLSGKKVHKFADLYLTQWEHLAQEGGPDFRGTIL
jgi:UDP-N-acetylglucosamine:LPS N-acetylglucosamine transferase